MIAGKDFGITALTNIKEDIVLQQIKQDIRGENRLESHVIVSHFSCWLFPFHVSVFLGSHRAYLCESHIAHYVKGVICEQRRDKLLIVTQLQIGFACISLFPAWRFQFDDHQWQTIDKHHYVRAFCVEFLHGELIHHQEVVRLWIVKVYQPYNPCLLPLLCLYARILTAIESKVFANHIGGIVNGLVALWLRVAECHLNAILQHLGELEVAFIQRRALNLMQFLYGIIYGIEGQSWVNALQ